MCPIRHSLFDLVRQREQSLKDTKLAERPHRENGLSIREKIANDIYIIFQFLEGANNMSELRQCNECRIGHISLVVVHFINSFFNVFLSKLDYIK
jgi:hypothetical protein